MTPTFTAHCLTVHNPFHPMRNRELQIIEEPVSIRSLVPQTNKPVIVVRNAEYVLRADWDQEVKDGDSLAVVFLPQGGGNGGSDVGRIILTIVVLIVSYYVPFVGLEMTGWQAMAAAASISKAGSVVTNANIEVPK